MKQEGKAISGLGTFPEIPVNTHLVAPNHVPWPPLAARESGDHGFLAQHVAIPRKVEIL